MDGMVQGWSRNSRAMIKEHGAARFNEVFHVRERGCRATHRSIFGDDGSRNDLGAI